MTTSTAEPLARSLPADPRLTTSSFLDAAGKEPIRAELYGLETLEAHARELAAQCRVAPRGPAEGPLLQRLAHDGRVLIRAHRRITEAAGRQEPLSPDAEWLLDNSYVVEEVLREVRHDLPRGYYRELPKLVDGPLAGYPRVYALALYLIAHTDSSLDENHITRFVQAYQAVTPLTIGELWAVPTMLRLGLIENLRRLAEQMLQAWDEHRRAEAWVAPLARQPQEQPPAKIVLATAERLDDSFIVHSLQVLRNSGAPDAVAQVERYLAEHGTAVGEVVRRENQRQAVNQVSVGNCVTSLRLLGALDWSVFFERTNLVEPILREDPAGVYERQDFATRDRYRQVVEKLARRSRFTEVEVARQSVKLARDGWEVKTHTGDRAALDHVGYYLIGPGLATFKKQLGYRPGLRERLLNAVLSHPRAVYFGASACATVLLLALLAWLALPAGPGLWLLVLPAALVPVSELAVGLVNYLLTLFLPPRTLPKLQFREGIPPDCATFVVMPSLLVRPQSAAALLERLEIHYLGNPEPQLRFALLTDFGDAPTEHQPEDDGYVQAALDGIKALNERYAADGPPRFFLFHRRRRWNAVQGCWMGCERKRGKLEEFNRLLRGDQCTSYSVCSGDPSHLPRTRFVITLDLDTQLPREAARRLVGALAHPLNRARFDPEQGRVVEGYGVLQPRVSFHLPAANRSLFTRIWVASAGLDPYSTAVSDIYQDLFGSGSFTGKGIYDLDAFEAATGNTFPDNHILSHDLIEGNYARCGLVTDIELFDDFPARYHAYARREHRWIRGDWQLLPWLGRTTPAPSAGTDGQSVGGTDCQSVLRRPNPLPALERWKVLDNLRRSLVPPALVLWLTLSWTVLPAPLSVATGLALAVLLLPLLLQTLGALLQTLRNRSLAPLRDLRSNAPATLGQIFLSGVFLLNQAYLAVDAIARTLVRLYGTRRRLLEWETAASAERRLGTGFRHFCLTMWQPTLLAVLLGVLVWLLRAEALAAAGPFLLAWFLSPVVAFWVSRPLPRAEAPLSAAERRELRRITRQTWGFFETFVGDEDHWLPPDNFQEQPRGQVAHRTSPTNQGLLLLSTLAAQDLGYLGLSSLVSRLEKTFATLGQLERFRGHFYNWYDTLTLQPLQPTYVSTVDSGNLLGCFVTLKQGLYEKVREPILGPTLREGLNDTLGILAELARPSPARGHSADARSHQELEALLQALGRQLQEQPADLPAWASWLERLSGHAPSLLSLASRLAETIGPNAGDLHLWAQRFATQVDDRRAELAELAPWLALLGDPAAEQCRSALAPVADAARRWETLSRKLTVVFTLGDFDTGGDDLVAELAARADNPALGERPAAWLRQVREAVRKSSAARLLDRCRRLAEWADALAGDMDFRFLYKHDRHLFSIGYHVPQARLDAPCYDLLASEARLASFLAIARGDAPRRHWFHLGRLLTRVGRQFCLISWGGTIFEYLMPRLLLRDYDGTLLLESNRAAVARQIEYGRERGVPWGISESAFSSQYLSYDYQYQSFGVPGLGLKRGLGQDLVIAPYATALAAMIRPHDALANFRRLAVEGAAGRYGFYESIDYTRSRLPEGKRALVVRCFMAHHQGMTLVALANCLLGGPSPRRFHAEPMVRATELLLQERVPRAASTLEPSEHAAAPRPAGQERTDLVSRRLTTSQTPGPRAHLLSNQQYSVMVTNAGAGYSRCGNLDVTRWREDYTRDDVGQFCYVRDLGTGQFWSAGYQPVRRVADSYEVVFSADKAEFRRLDGPIATHLEITVSPEQCCEIRRVTLANHDTRFHDLELTSYAEVVLAPHGADLAHPAFGKLFLETEWEPAQGALLCRRRPRSPDQKASWAVHTVTVMGVAVGQPEFETDRARFLGRGRSPAAPAALDPGVLLSGTTGPVLDPIFSLRRRIRLAPGAAGSVVFCTAVTGSRDEALALADHYRDPQSVLRAFDLAWAHSQIELRHLRLSTTEAHLFQRLASHLIYTGPMLRAGPAVLIANRQGQTGLWRHGVSGDRSILLVRVGDSEEIPLVRQLLAAHAYWRLKGLEVDLVILSEEPTSYIEELNQQLQEALRASDSHDLVDKPGGVCLRKADQMTEEDRVLLQAVARVVLAGNRGTLAAQVERIETVVSLPALLPVARTRKRPDAAREVPTRLPAGLLFANGWGGFTPDGREYCILPYATSLSLYLPPAPWINVIANPVCGFLVSESGLGYTWAANSQQNRLTPWSNDPVADPPGEVVYLRDEDTGDIWTPTPRPLGMVTPTLVRHGQGYTVFEQQSHALRQELLVFVPVADPIKVISLKVRNTGDRPRRLSATFYAEWVLGLNRDQAPLQVRTELDTDSGALLARNAFNEDFGAQLAFADVNLRPHTLTADRTEFLGRNGSVAAPAALSRQGLSGRVGPALDPCAALQAKFDLRPGEQKEIVFFLGSAGDVPAVRQLLERYKEPGRVQSALKEVRGQWDRMLTAVQVRTPDPALDLLLNRWLPYQVLSCRVWGRSAFYQSGGAYGFRDQLQDVMALVYGAPEETRAQILRAAAHQFVEGDVQHWWHPPMGRGVRTHISDDYLWLPFVVCHYVCTTGDTAVLDERVPYLQAPLLQPGQEDAYGLPQQADETGTLYDHCVRALRHGLQFGTHGLPLMGTGDWNDGMNRVGAGGKGESVWNGWFLLTCLARFGELAEARGDTPWATTCRDEADRLHAAIEKHAWDGNWYRRAYFDDGTPLGSAENDECRIDSIAQSWAVLSGAAHPQRARQALAAVDEQLVRRDDGLILLFTPPFDKGQLEPGYVKGYVPGIRENGGQYTHAATWVVQAAALLGQGTRALELFNLLSPIRHTATPEQVARYRVEPYVVVADIYGAPPHTGRGGWTWYTGSAAWLFRVGLEAILGFRLHGTRLRLDPCIPRDWPSCTLTYRYRSASYHITVENPRPVEQGVQNVSLDGRPCADGWIDLADDGGSHEVRVVLG